MVEVTVATIERHSAIGLGWEAVTFALEHTNMCAEDREKVQAFLEEHELTGEPVLLVDIASIGARRWQFTVDGDTLFIDDSFGGGWNVFRQGDVDYLWSESASSGSTLEARLCDDATWDLVLEVPIADGTPYHGAYFQSFQLAVAMLPSDDRRWSRINDVYESEHGEDSFQRIDMNKLVALPIDFDSVPTGWELLATAAGYSAYRTL